MKELIQESVNSLVLNNIMNQYKIVPEEKKRNLER
jgi:hypothetical protein